MPKRSKQRNVDEAKQHSLTDFLLTFLDAVLWIAVSALAMLLLWPLLFAPSRWKTSQPNYKLLKLNSTTFRGIAFRRSQMEQDILHPKPLTPEQQAMIGVTWHDLGRLEQTYRFGYPSSRTTSKTNLNVQGKTNTSPARATCSEPSEPNSTKDSE